MRNHFKSLWPGHLPAMLVLVVLLLSPLSARSSNNGYPPPFDARYDIIVNGLFAGQAQRKLSRQDDGSLVFESHTRPMGIMTWFRSDEILERTHWRIDADGQPVPIDYSYQRSGGSKDRRVDIRFDNSTGKITTTVDGDSWDMPFTENAIDKLLYHILLMRDADSGQEILSYPVADGGTLKNYRFQVEARETIDSPQGRLKTIRIKRLRDTDKRNTVIWFAPAQHNLPVRVEHRKKGGLSTTLVLESVNWMR